MKEKMFSAIDKLDNLPSLFWVKGDFMCVTSDSGFGDPWRDRLDDFDAYPQIAFEEGRMINPILLWEREP